jgi:uncharacterized protein YuzE
MTILYTKDANILSIHLGGDVEETIEFQEGLYLDIDKDGQVIGIEAHDAQAFLERASTADGIELPSVVRGKILVKH